MTTDERLKAVLDRVLSWSPERKQDAVEILTSLEVQDNSPLRLSDEQVVEVERRRSEEAPRNLTLQEFDQRLRRFGV